MSHQNQNANSYYILKWPLTNPTYGTIGDYDQSNSYDHFFVQEAENQMFVYIVRKLTSTYTATGSSYYAFQYLRMKHHIVNGYYLYLLGRPWSKRYTCSASSSWIQTNRANNYFGTFTIDAIDAQAKYNGDWCWHFASINTKTAHDISLNTDDDSTMVIEVRMSWGRTWSELSTTSTHCNIESGVIGSDALNPVYCVLDRNNGRLLIYNVYSLTNQYLKFYYYARTANSQNDYDVEVRAYANTQAFSDYNWPLFKSTTNTNYDLVNNVFYASRSYSSTSDPLGTAYVRMDPSDGSYEAYTDILRSGISTDRSGGYAQIISVSSTQIKVRMRLYSNRDFADRTFRMGFRFYTERLTMSSCSSVSVWNSRHGTGTWGSGSWSRSCGTSTRRFYVVWTFYRVAYTQNQWPYWYSGDYTDLTFNFGSVGHHRSANPNYLHATATLVWETTRYHANDQGKCGCCGNCCGSYCRTYTCGWFSGGWSIYTCTWVTLSSCCSYYCCSYCSCRWYYDWSYIAVTGKSDIYYSTPVVNTIAQTSSIGVTANQYGA